jgi:micrococcal nuclease
MPTLLLLLLFPAFALAGTLTGRVVGVADGDTITVLSSGNQQTKIRLDSIDAPEKKQPFGTVAKQALSDMVFNEQVTIEASTKDRYGRTIGEVWRDSELVNLTMVKSGMAWVYRKYAKNTTTLKTRRKRTA